MKIISRTARSLKNSITAIGFYAINLCLQFFSRKIFLEYLGTEILGLNTTAMNLLQFLNLAELGISAAVGFTLYKPIYERNINTINEIVTLQGYLYRRIAYFIIVGALILMYFFPLIFAEISIPLWYAYASFGVLLTSALLGYFINYKQIVLTANQQDYKVLYSFKSVMLVKIIFQMIAVRFWDNGYIWWLIFEVMFAFIGSYALDKMTRKTFPFLSTSRIPFKELKIKYPTFTIKIKQLFFHKIGGFAIGQAAPLIVYGYTSLTVVALYGNYLIVVNGIIGLMNAMFNSMSAGIGNLVAEGDDTRIISVFNELFSVRFFIISSLCFTTFNLMPSFISLWIGSQYVMPTSTSILIITTMYISLSRYSVDAFINAYGLFQDIWSPIAEATINITTSIFLGYYYGLNGVLMGGILSLLLVIKIWKPYFLFKSTIKGYFKKYVFIYFKHLSIAFIIAFLSWKILFFISPDPNINIGNLILAGILNLIVFGGLLAISLIVTNCGLKQFIRRFVRIEF